MPIELILYSRSYCHLCHDMQIALSALADSKNFTIRLVDVDADPALTEKYDELVPVVWATDAEGQGHILCHYFLDEARIIQFLENNRSG